MSWHEVGNVGLVTMTAKRYYNMLKNGNTWGGSAAVIDATLKLDDLVQEGYMGIMEAAERFDSTKGFQFIHTPRIGCISFVLF